MNSYTDRDVRISKNKLSSKAKLGITIILLSVALLFCLIVNILPFIRSFTLGVFGLAAYPVVLLACVIGGLLTRRKQYHVATNYIISLSVLYFLLICVLHTALTSMDVIDFAEYLSNMYNVKTTPGGVLAGIFSYIFVKLFGYTSTYILYAVGAVICGAFIFDYYLKVKDYKKLNSRMVNVAINNEVSGVDQSKNPLPTRGKTESINSLVQKQPASKNIGVTLKARKKESENDEMVEHIAGEEQQGYNRAQSAKEKLFGLANQSGKNNFSIDSFVNRAHQSLYGDKEEKDNSYFPTFNQDSSEEDNDTFEPKRFNQFDDNDTFYEPEPARSSLSSAPSTSFNTFDEDDDIMSSLDRMINEVPTSVAPPSMSDKKHQFSSESTQLEMQQTLPTPNPTTTYKRPSPYVKPPVSMLTVESTKQEGNEEYLKQQSKVLEQTLESFKISATVVGITQGPAVTRYEIQMPAGISVKKIIQHADDIAMSMRSYNGVRIEAPIPGKNLVGIEIPNEKIATVGLADIINSPEFKNAKAPLTVAIGKDISGAIRVCDLATTPHLLVAGATGSGKSVCLNVILISLLYRLGPDDLKLILVDPKRVEFSSFNGIPQLLTKEAIVHPKQALNALDWAISEMENRFDNFQRLRVRDINEYNSLDAVYKGKEPKLPRIVIVVDELADLMMMARKDLEDKIMRIAQLSRAAGIHLILATQRPSVNVITGTIKANLPSRIAFAVNSYSDSNTIINQGGAEKLLGRGDSLFAPQNLPEPVRVQCPFVSNTEVLNIVEFIKENNDSDDDDARSREILEGKQEEQHAESSSAEGGNSEFDPILPKALLDFIRSGTGSISAVQRRYSVGYARAARIVDQMEQAGFISSPDGTNKNRQVLIDEERYNEIFSNE
ncbi:MAG: DNA translocase FtsK [Clostridia bacterium]|nr:DNA translocase FtsK [Clostridia bacterium]